MTFISGATLPKVAQGGRGCLDAPDLIRSTTGPVPPNGSLATVVGRSGASGAHVHVPGHRRFPRICLPAAPRSKLSRRVRSVSLSGAFLYPRLFAQIADQFVAHKSNCIPSLLLSHAKQHGESAWKSRSEFASTNQEQQTEEFFGWA